jgi:hypothetical protein
VDLARAGRYRPAHAPQCLRSRALPAGADLKRALVVAMLDHIDTGWRLGEFSSRTGFFFCDKAGERRMVEISPSDPGTWPHA